MLNSIADYTISGYIATIFLYTGIVAIYFAARNNGGVKKVWAMLASLFAMAIISSLSSLGRLGIQLISPQLLMQVFSVTEAFIGISITIIFTRKYILYKKIKKHGYKPVDVVIALPEKDEKDNERIYK